MKNYLLLWIYGTIRKMKCILNNFSLLKKILISIMLSSLLFAGAASVFALYYVTKANKKLLYLEIAKNLVYSGNKIASTLHSIENISNLMIADSVIQNNLYMRNSDNWQDRNIAYKSLYESVISYFFELRPFSVSSVALVNNTYTISSDMTLSREMDPVVKDDLVRTADREEGAPVWITRYGNKQGIFMVRTVRRIEHMDFDILGEIAFSLDLHRLLDEATWSPYRSDKPLFFFFDHGELFYESGIIDKSEIPKIVKTLAACDYGVVKVQNSSYFAVKSTIPGYGWTYVCLVSYREIARATTFTCLIYFLITALGISISILVCYLLIHSIAKHINFLVAKISAFRGDSGQLPFTHYDYSGRHDEIGVLHQQFDLMVSEINELIQKNYKSELLMKDAQLAALENQINPHFLYNTLESVNWRAKAIGAQTISSMIESLGSLLRITLSDSAGNYTLGRELELVDYYLTIQKLRFEDRLDVTIQCDDAVRCCLIPKLSIQPLVENAIHYALEDSIETCHILIQTSVSGKKVIITVSNSGSCFEDSTLKDLKNGMVRQHRTGIGLLNIDKRIKLTFGTEYGLIVYNKNDMAVAELTVPFQCR